MPNDPPAYTIDVRIEQQPDGAPQLFPPQFDINRFAQIVQIILAALLAILQLWKQPAPPADQQT